MAQEAETLHLLKMAAGMKDAEQLRRAFSPYLAGAGRMRVRTRNMPKRAAELSDGGSLYWIAGGFVVGRQVIAGIAEGAYGDGGRCAVITVETPLIEVARSPRAAFRGWRYMEASKAPPDIAAHAASSGADGMPEEMRRELAALGLL